MISTYTGGNRTVPGNRALFIIEAQYVGGVSVIGGEGTAVSTTTTWKRIYTDDDSLERSTNILSTRPNRYEHSVTFTASKARKELNTLSDALRLSSFRGIVALVLDNNGIAWVVGFDNRTGRVGRPLRMLLDSFDSDENMRRYELKTVSNYGDIPLSSTMSGKVNTYVSLGTDAFRFSTGGIIYPTAGIISYPGVSTIIYP